MAMHRDQYHTLLNLGRRNMAWEAIPEIRAALEEAHDKFSLRHPVGQFGRSVGHGIGLSSVMDRDAGRVRPAASSLRKPRIRLRPRRGIGTRKAHRQQPRCHNAREHSPLVAQLEARMTAQRTAAGIAALKATGASYGALPVLSKTKVRLLKKLRKTRRKGKRVWTIAKLAERFGVSTATVNNYLTGRTRPRT